MFINGKQYTEAMDSEFNLFDMERNPIFGHQFVPNKYGAICGTQGVQSFVNRFLKKRYIEVGTFDGIVISQLAQQHPYKEFHAIDLFATGINTGAGCLRYFIKNNKDLPNVHLHIGTSEDAIERIKELTFDVIFIDGDHGYDWVKKDITLLYPLLEPFGIISFHDYNMDGVLKAISEFGFEIMMAELAYAVKK